jgi:periplasmic protein TonB
MKADTVLQSDLLDILFEHRNKEYGAYTLRKEYDHRLMIALTAMFSLVILFFAWFFFNNDRNRNNAQILPPAEDSIVLRVVEMPRDPLPPPPPPPAMKPQPPVATIKSTPPVIVPNDVVADPPPSTDQLEKDDAVISNTTTDGKKPDVTMQVSPCSGEHGSGPVQPQPVIAPEPEDKVWIAVEKMPEFPGGNAALIRFLGKHLRVPEDKLDAGERMRVPVKFVVDMNGMLTDVQFSETADEEYKSEIRRVMKKMPKWIPGIQNGKPVAVYFSIPIIFEVSDQ